MHRFALPRVRAALAALALVALPACDSSEPTPPTTDNILFGLNYTRLFAEPTDAEAAAVRADWGTRAPSSSDYAVESVTTTGNATVTVFRHTVTATGCETVTHYAAVRVPTGVGLGAPLLVVHHGGDNGFSIGATGDTGLDGLTALFPELFAETVQVMPVYRSEPLVTPSETYTATGEPSPWDCDVDDAMAAVDAVLSAPQFIGVVSLTRRAALGFSRGGATASIHAVRDDQMDALVDYYGPSDFFHDTVQGLTTQAVNGVESVLNLPGVRYLAEEVLLPLRNADASYNPNADYAGARLELVRRSPGLFASDLPPTQVHHHRGDAVVPFPFSEAFRDRATARGAQSFELFLYGEAEPANPIYHRPGAMPESLDRVQDFLLARLDTAN